MLYEMLAGQAAVRGRQRGGGRAQAPVRAAAADRELRPDVNPALEAVVMAALAKDPAQRWQSADDFAAALVAARRAAAATATATVAAHGRVRAGAGAGGRRCRRPPSRLPRRGAQAAALALVHARAAGAAARRRCSRSWPSAGCCRRRRSTCRAVVRASSCSRRARALEQRGFEVAETRVQSAAAARPGDRPGPEPGRRGRQGLGRHARGLGRAGHDVACRRSTNLSEKQAVRTLNQAGPEGELIDAQESDDVRGGLAIRTVPGRGRGGRERHARAAARQQRAGAGRPCPTWPASRATRRSRSCDDAGLSAAVQRTRSPRSRRAR